MDRLLDGQVVIWADCYMGMLLYGQVVIWAGCYIAKLLYLQYKRLFAYPFEYAPEINVFHILLHLHKSCSFIDIQPIIKVYDLIFLNIER